MLQDRRTYTFFFITMILLLVPSYAWAGNFFKLGNLEYFEIAKKQKLKRQEHVLDWRQPIFNADGKVSYYQPPKTVLDLLNDPTPKNAQNYLKWQKEKMERIARAQEAVDLVSKENTH